MANVAFAGVLLIVTLPLMILVAIAIKLDSRGPILVREPRVDRRGRRFLALRFRITADGSPREAEVTFVGNIIHYLRVDNLPQLSNVLRGEMTCFTGDSDCTFLLD